MSLLAGREDEERGRLMKRSQVSLYEDLARNEWPAFQTLFYQGWVIRIAGGYTRRANSVQVLSQDNRRDWPRKVSFCESVYEKHGLKTTFKLTPFSRKLDTYLEKRSYRKVSESCVMTLSLKGSDVFSSRENCVTFDHPSPVWVSAYAAIAGLSGGGLESFSKILSLIEGKTGFVMWMSEGKAVAVGTGVLEEKRVGLLNIHVRSDSRRKGWGRRTVLEILDWGRRNGAEEACLQVIADNNPAIRLYKTLGFREIYRYWYREK